VGIINRYLPTDKTKVIDAIDKTLSLEGKNLDKDGAAESVRGLAEELSGNVRFTSVTVVDDIKFKTSGFESFPTPLKWEIVEMICAEKNTDALFALERYDTDTHVNYSSQKAYEDYNNKPALNYVRILENRKYKDDIVKGQ
jgi:hypothetical protein